MPIAGYTKAIRLKPDDARCIQQSKLQRATWDIHFAAIADYDIAIRLKPDLLMHTGQSGTCKKIRTILCCNLDYDIAIRLKPNDAVHTTIGEVQRLT